MGSQAEEVDVLIVGSGSAGVFAATWLAIYQIPGIKVKILESRPEPMKMGQADGVQCRTVEIFESFGLAEDLLREAYHVLEVAFWSPDGKGGIHRTSRTADTQPGLSHMPHVILNQARINGLMLQKMETYGLRVDYGYKVTGLAVDEALVADHSQYCTTVTAEDKHGAEHVFHARYVLGCDGAHSSVRKSLGFTMVGDSTDAVWGVMDIYPQTNYPDIRRKSTIHSESGSLLIIPREGGSLCRFYIELPPGTNVKAVTLADLHAKARQIFPPFTIDFADTAWWSCYSIGQRLADRFVAHDRVFLTGDAFHTHSPKAGQGMNVSLQDGFNIGWKLGMVLRGQAGPELLRTYAVERGATAKNLIDFDRAFTKLFNMKANKESGLTPEQFSQAFVKAGRYTAGLTSQYDDTSLVGAATSTQALASEVTVGMRMPSAQVVRFCDAKAMQLVQTLKADGRFRILIFAGRVEDQRTIQRLEKIAAYLDSPEGPVRRHSLPSTDIDSFIEPIIVLNGERIKLEQEQIPDYFWPTTGKWKMRDLHKLFVDDESYNSGHGHAYAAYGIDADQGAMVIVRPDQYVSKVISLDDLGGIGDFFAGFARDVGLNGAHPVAGVNGSA